jgi:hypothetical protein
MKTNNIKITSILAIAIFLFVQVNYTFAQKQTKIKYDQKAAKEYSVNDVISFIYEWFAGFDHQKDVNYFLKHIAEPVDMNFPDFPIKSKEDFKRWYKGVEDNIVWNSHALTNVQVTGSEKNGWKASYDVLWKARDIRNQDIEILIHQELYLIRKGNLIQIAKHRAYPHENKR